MNRRYISMKRKADYAYYVEGNPIMSDDAYDSLIEKIAEFNPNHPVLAKVGVESTFNKERHNVSMRSQQKVHNVPDLEAWGKKIGVNEFVYSWKVDGLSLELIYEDGELITALTRGDGIHGEDVFLNALQIDDIPKIIEGFTGSVCGEVYIPKDVASSFGAASPRNFAVGSLKQKDPSVTKARKLSFIAWSWDGTTDMQQMFTNLGLMGFKHPYLYTGNILEIVLDSLMDERDNPDYEVDGIIIACKNEKDRIRIGEDRHHPKWAMALKFPPQKKLTKVKNIKHQLGRNGRITPVIEIEPIFLSGAEISNVSGHNYPMMKDLGIGIGAEIEVQRSGDVIPHVNHVVEKANFSIPNVCPECKGQVELRGKYLHCVNVCNKSKEVLHWIEVLEITGMGPSVVEKLNLNNILELLAIEPNNITSQDGLGQKSAQSILLQINKIKSEGVIEEKILDGFGIPFVGERMSRTLIKEFGNIITLRDCTLNDLTAVEGIGEATSESIVEYFRINSEFVDKIITIIPAKEKIESAGSALTGATFCITGTLSNPRKVIETKIRENGGEMKSLSGKTTMLVVGDNPGSKVEKAKKLGVRVITEKELIEMLGE